MVGSRSPWRNGRVRCACARCRRTGKSASAAPRGRKLSSSTPPWRASRRSRRRPPGRRRRVLPESSNRRPRLRLSRPHGRLASRCARGLASKPPAGFRTRPARPPRRLRGPHPRSPPPLRHGLPPRDPRKRDLRRWRRAGLPRWSRRRAPRRRRPASSVPLRRPDPFGVRWCGAGERGADRCRRSRKSGGTSGRS